MKPGQRARRFLLTVHVVSSLGWLGGAAAFIVVAGWALASQRADVVRAAYLAAEPITNLAIVPLAVVALASGSVQGLATSWGLFRHYWVLFTLIAGGVLLQYTTTVSHYAALATSADAVDVAALPSYLLHSGGGLLVLLLTTVLGIYKPRGLTPYGQRRT